MDGNIPLFNDSQKDRSVIHPSLPQPQNDSGEGPPECSGSFLYSFVVAADPQLGMGKNNEDWSGEKEYSEQAVAYLNDQVKAGKEPPLFCCVCGDLVHMTAELYAKDVKPTSKWTREECDQIQDAQFDDFKSIWSKLHPDIALVCVCGNHDVGNRPTAASIQRFKTRFGDDYLAFWAKQSYNIILNTNLFNDQSAAPELYDEQFAWLEERLQYAVKNQARHIFVFGHHPWFLYNEDEDEAEMTTFSPIPLPPPMNKVDDKYFLIPKATRSKVLPLFEKYKVNAAFAGHFHQNLVSQTSFGMPMIITGPLSMLLDSNGIPEDFDEPKTRGLRFVDVKEDGTFDHKFVSI